MFSRHALIGSALLGILPLIGCHSTCCHPPAGCGQAPHLPRSRTVWPNWSRWAVQYRWSCLSSAACWGCRACAPSANACAKLWSAAFRQHSSGTELIPFYRQDDRSNRSFRHNRLILRWFRS